MASGESELATVATYPQAVTAHMARNFLEEHGVSAFVVDEHLARQVWENFSGVNVQVPANDAGRAMALLKTISQS